MVAGHQEQINWTSHVPVYIMDEDTLSMYATYMAALGNREDLFPDSGYVPSYTTPPIIYEIPPSALEDETFAALIAEAEKHIGYPYVWGGSNPNTSFDCSGIGRVCQLLGQPFLAAFAEAEGSLFSSRSLLFGTPKGWSVRIWSQLAMI